MINSDPPGRHSNDASFSAGYTTYAISLLFVINMVNYMDRMVLSVLLPSIKADLGLSDSQLGWLTGMAFALFYGTAGIPIARLADVWIRKHVIAISMVGWSAMTMLSGATSNFATILLARIGVGLGEAGCIPPGHSVISDLTPQEKRAGALAVFTAGSTVGMIVGLSLGGWLSEQVGWRWTFVIFGAPGVLLAIMVMLTMREPPRGQFDGGPSQTNLTTREVVFGLFSRPSYLHLIVGYGLITFVTFGFAQWLPTYYMRTFGLSMTAIGMLTGFGLGAGMTIGTLVGGAIANRLMPKDMRWGLWIGMIGLVVSVLLFSILVNAYDYRIAFAAHFLQASIIGMANGPIFATLQAVARPGERATASAIAAFAASLIGLGGGPLVVGYLSDFFAGAGAENPLRNALAVAGVLPLWPIIHLVFASRTLKADIAKVASDSYR